MKLRASTALGAVVAAGLAASSAMADVTVSNHATMHMSCSAGICTPTAAMAILNVGDLQTMLAASSVTVKSNAAAPDIRVSGALTWASASTLTLDAYRSVAIGKAVSITGTAGLTVTTNDGGSGGSLSFPAMGRAIFWDLGSSLTINGTGYTLLGDIATLAADVRANASGHYALANDYDASVDGAYAQSPVVTSLDGSFEGLGNTISRLTIRAPGRFPTVGLFTQLDPSGAISDLRLTRLSARGPHGGGVPVMGGIVGSGYGLMSGDTVSGAMSSPNGGFIGGLVGIQGGGTITGAISTVTITAGGDPTIGTVAGNAAGVVTASHGAGTLSVTGTTTNGTAGGLVGAVHPGGQITASDATGTISGAAFSGGLAGEVGAGGSVSGSHASVTVSGFGPASVGGLIGVNGGTLTTSYATGSASEGSLVGGLVGSNPGSIDQCFATGAASGSETGGLVGNNTGTITNAYATGTVNGDRAGGLVGMATNTGESIATSYATGNVSGTSFTGGLIGEDRQPGFTSSSYWDISGNITNPSQGAGSPANDPGVTGLTTAQLQSGLPSGFNPSMWGSNPSINGGLPYLLAAPPP